MTQVDDMFINYYDSKKVKRVLTPDGYTIDKEGYEIFGVTLAEAEQGAEKVTAVTKDIGVGAARGFAKLTEGTGSLALAGLEKLNFISDGSVEKFGEFFAKEVYPRIGETETLAGGLTEGISQFLVPGVGYYKLFGALMTVPKNASRIKKFVNSVGKVTAAEGAAVGTAQVAGDPNFASFLNEFLNIDQKLAEGITKDFAVYLTTPETSKDADAVLKEKLKATIADTPVAYAAEGLMAFAKILKAFKKEPEVVEEITSFNITNNPKANKLEVEGLLAFVKNNPNGFTISIDGKPTPTSGFVLAPIKQTELIFDAKTIDYEDIVKLKDNVKFLFKTYQDMGIKDMRVYAGGWLDTDPKSTTYNKYVLDASVIIDNKADALYIANAGKQNAIFDLGEFNEIKTSEGIEELKQSGSYDINKFNVRQSDNVKLVEGFEGARLASEGGTN
jgi:hypothetical protein